MTKKEQVEQAIAKAFPGDPCTIEDYAGDDDHFRITLSSPQFKNMNNVDRQKKIYAALGDLTKIVHAFEFKIKMGEDA